jgi:hypothetical protein
MATCYPTIFTLLSKIGPIRFVLTQVLKEKNWFPFSGFMEARAKDGLISDAETLPETIESGAALYVFQNKSVAYF